MRTIAYSALIVICVAILLALGGLMEHHFKFSKTLSVRSEYQRAIAHMLSSEWQVSEKFASNLYRGTWFKTRAGVVDIHLHLGCKMPCEVCETVDLVQINFQGELEENSMAVVWPLVMRIAEPLLPGFTSALGMAGQKAKEDSEAKTYRGDVRVWIEDRWSITLTENPAEEDKPWQSFLQIRAERAAW